MKKYTDRQSIFDAKPMTNHEFMLRHEDCQPWELADIPLQEGYFVSLVDDKIELTSWYPQAVFDKKFKQIQ